MDVLKEFHKIVAQRRNVSQQVFVEKSIRETENINAGITSKKDRVISPGYIIQHPWLKDMFTVPQIIFHYRIINADMY